MNWSSRMSKWKVVLMIAVAVSVTSPSSAEVSLRDRLVDALYTHFIQTYFSYAGASREVETGYPIVRWSDQIRISTNLTATTDLNASILTRIDRLVTEMKRAGFDVVLLPSFSTEANARILFDDGTLSTSEPMKSWIKPSYDGIDQQFRKVERILSKRGTCAMGGLLKAPFEIGYSFALINATLDESQLLHCVNNITLGILGFQESNGYSAEVTVFAKEADKAKFTDLDRLLLKVLADPRLAKGMTYDESTTAILLDVCKDIVNREDYKSILARLDRGEGW